VVDLQRQAMTDEDISWWAAAAQLMDESVPLLGTNIIFGGLVVPAGTIPPANHVRYCVHIPLNGKPTLYVASPRSSNAPYYYWIERDWTGGSLSACDYKGMATTGKRYWIGVIDDCLCVSEEGFEDGFAYYQFRDRGQPIIGIGGQVQVTNFPGQCKVGIAPVTFATEGTGTHIGRQPFYVGQYEMARTTGACYGQSLNILGGGVTTYYTFWASNAPPWWPTITQQQTSYPFNFMSTGMYINYQPTWPPSGPPGEWPPFPPWGWPQNVPWPPVDLAGEIRDAMLETGIHAVNPSLTGGEVILWWGPSPAMPDAVWWDVEMRPLAYHPTPPIGYQFVNTYATPFVSAVSLWQAAGIEFGAAPSWTDLQYPFELISNDSSAATGDRAMSGTYELEIDNREELHLAPASPPGINTRLGSAVRLALGWTMNDLSSAMTDLGIYYLMELMPTPEKVRFALADILGVLALAKWNKGNLTLRDWNPLEAIRFLLNSEGIDNSMMNLEDLRFPVVVPPNAWAEPMLHWSQRERKTVERPWIARISGYEEDDPWRYWTEDQDWSYSQGVPIVEVIADILWRGQYRAAIWYDQASNTIVTGCPYCRTHRSGDKTSTNWWYHHMDNGWASTGCLAADLARCPLTAGVDRQIVLSSQYDASTLFFGMGDIGGTSGALDDEAYANQLIVMGQDEIGKPIGYLWEHLDSRNPAGAIGSDYVGWSIGKMEGDAALRSWVWVLARVWDVTSRIAARHLDIHELPVPLMPDIRPGLVLNIQGGTSVGTHNANFRVVGVTHDGRGRTSRLGVRKMVGAPLAANTRTTVMIGTPR
jgi:hypothetical protein